jgi:hypothetical protein
MFRRAAIHAALGSAKSFTTHLEKWRKQKEKTTAKGKKFSIRPPVPPRSWSRSVTLYAGQWKERTTKSIVRNTSRDCARCSSLIARYDAKQSAEGYTPGAPLVYCPQCQMRDNSDRNAALVIGKRLLARYQQTSLKEKPHAPLQRAERTTKVEGVRRSQVAEDSGRPSANLVRHGTAHAQGNAQDISAGMVADISGMVRQLRLFNES